MELQKCEFEEFQSLIYRECGIKLESGKEHLIQFRLAHRLEELGILGFRAYLDLVKRPEGRTEMGHLLDAISTNVTYFFREPTHFEFVQDLVSDWSSQGRKSFNFWSAACSSGEEPYSLAMALADCGLPADRELKIQASDLSLQILEQAKRGIYASSKLANLPPGFQSKYFDAISDQNFSIKPKLKENIVFHHQNLIVPPYLINGPLDVIFLRNVMIYFDLPLRNRIINECYRLLRPGGILLLGHSESLRGLETPFKCIKPSYYLKA